MMTLAELGVALAIGVASYSLVLAVVIWRCRRNADRAAPRFGRRLGSSAAHGSSSYR